MSKWGELIKYLNSVDAKPSAVLKMCKAAYGKKGRVSPTRTAWKLNVIVSIMNQKDKSIDGRIYRLVSKNKVYRLAYNALHTNKYSDKTEQQHYNACKKVWNDNKELRNQSSRLSKLQRMKLQRSPAALAEFLN